MWKPVLVQTGTEKVQPLTVWLVEWEQGHGKDPISTRPESSYQRPKYVLTRNKNYIDQYRVCGLVYNVESSPSSFSSWVSFRCLHHFPSRFLPFLTQRKGLVSPLIIITHRTEWPSVLTKRKWWDDPQTDPRRVGEVDDPGTLRLDVLAEVSERTGHWSSTQPVTPRDYPNSSYCDHISERSRERHLSDVRPT